jgi:hypothetical protein
MSSAAGTYGEHILSRPFEGLGDFIQSRANDDAIESKRIEQFRLPQADAQARVRFRFTLVGTGSWFWGIDDFALFGVVAPIEAPRLTRVSATAGAIELEWTGAQGPYQIQSRSNLFEGGWVNQGSPLAASQHTVLLPMMGSTHFFRILVAH